MFAGASWRCECEQVVLKGRVALQNEWLLWMKEYSLICLA